MAKSKEKLQALALRQSGVSITAIAQKLHVSKSSASLWCRDIALSEKQQKFLYQKMIRSGDAGRAAGAIANKKRREEAIIHANKKAEQQIATISKRDLLFLGLGLYWGEGSKNTENRFILVNSDPHIIKVVLIWLREIMNIPQEFFVPQIYINKQHEYRVEKVAQYWIKEINIPAQQFRKPIYIHTPHKKIYANHETYMGVLHLYVRKSSALKYATMGMLSAIKNRV